MICDKCFKREGQLVHQSVMGPAPQIGIKDPWVHRFYLCRYCRSAETLRRKRKPDSVSLPAALVAFRSNEELLAAWRKARS